MEMEKEESGNSVEANSTKVKINQQRKRGRPKKSAKGKLDLVNDTEKAEAEESNSPELREVVDAADDDDYQEPAVITSNPPMHTKPRRRRRKGTPRRAAV
ncbi:PREDICTED: uncharacterized protein [Prunus dulcis]|uniref:PREDICTED: uncharacterized protein n=1 Tax=Prunus dulcis TaxID=3755 RepID=A0A5E4FJR8_PRUDU|nr:PREDICTED: uncharacterized protein [Prunus dulcis]